MSLTSLLLHPAIKEIYYWEENQKEGNNGSNATIQKGLAFG
jgi:hypothetical protein